MRLFVLEKLWLCVPVVPQLPDEVVHPGHQAHFPHIRKCAGSKPGDGLWSQIPALTFYILWKIVTYDVEENLRNRNWYGEGGSVPRCIVLVPGSKPSESRVVS